MADSYSLTTLFDGFTHHHRPVVRAGYGALDQQHMMLRVNVDNLQILDGHALVSHVSRHLLAFEDAARRGAGADGARRTVAVGLAVRLRAPAEVPALHAALKALPF